MTASSSAPNLVVVNMLFVTGFLVTAVWCWGLGDDGDGGQQHTWGAEGRGEHAGSEQQSREMLLHGWCPQPPVHA